VELPIRKAKDGMGSIEPTTLIDEFKNSVKLYGLRPALSVKRN
jgi:hypothetical protein